MAYVEIDTIFLAQTCPVQLCERALFNHYSLFKFCQSKPDIAISISNSLEMTAQCKMCEYMCQKNSFLIRLRVAGYD